MALRLDWDKDAGGEVLEFTSSGTGTRRANPEPGQKLPVIITVNSDNAKVGPAMATYVTQASCPDGYNNSAGYRCPLLGEACYAESGMVKIHTMAVNKIAGFDYRSKGSKYSPDELAEMEAQAISSAEPVWRKKRKKIVFGGNTAAYPSPFVRLHVVGDCVTPSAARTVSSAASALVEDIPGATSGTKNVWVYTHAWGFVGRSDWSSRISVLASVDSQSSASQTVRRIEEAHGRGYAVSVVVPDYAQENGKRYGTAYKLPNGFTVIPCPYEVGKNVVKRSKSDLVREAKILSEHSARRMERTGRKLQCVDCQLCLRDRWLHDNKMVIAFALHGDKAARSTYKDKLIDPTEIKGVASAFGDAGEE